MRRKHYLYSLPERMRNAWRAWRNLRMYQDLALACQVTGDSQQAAQHLREAAWWYRFLQDQRRPIEYIPEGQRRTS